MDILLSLAKGLMLRVVNLVKKSPQHLMDKMVVQYKKMRQ